MVARISKVTDASLVYQVSLDPDEKASTVRTRIPRAAKIAGVEVAVRKAPRGWYGGLDGPERRSRAGRKAKAAG